MVAADGVPSPSKWRLGYSTDSAIRQTRLFDRDVPGMAKCSGRRLRTEGWTIGHSAVGVYLEHDGHLPPHFDAPLPPSADKKPRRKKMAISAPSCAAGQVGAVAFEHFTLLPEFVQGAAGCAAGVLLCAFPKLGGKDTPGR